MKTGVDREFEFEAEKAELNLCGTFSLLRFYYLLWP
jgi:hypothetical protein